MSEVGGLAARGRRRRLAWWLLVLLVAAGVGGWAYVNRPWETKPILVPVETVAYGPASRVLAVNGRIAPGQQVEISSTVSGRVASVAVNEGDQVAEGGTLLVIDDTQQRAALAQAQSQLDAAQARQTQAAMDYERAKALGDSISQKALDDARFAAETALKEVDRLAALLEQASSLLGEFTVRAPFSGTVLSRASDPGQVVSSSTTLFLFADLGTLRGEASVDEVYASEIRRGLTVKARPAGHTTVLDGEVNYVSPRVDSSTGGRLVRVALPQAGSLNLPAGLTVTLNIIVEERADALTLPRAALIGGDVPAVYVLEAGKAVRREVQYVDWPADRLIVTSGLAAGEVLVADSRNVTAGALVAAKD